jgi:hypothetical protein
MPCGNRCNGGIGNMNRLSWISKELWTDSKKNYKSVLKGVGLMFGMIGILKVLIFFDMKEIFIPLMFILLPIIMIYRWYSQSYDDEQKKIIKNIKGEK